MQQLLGCVHKPNAVASECVEMLPRFSWSQDPAWPWEVCVRLGDWMCQRIGANTHWHLARTINMVPKCALVMGYQVEMRFIKVADAQVLLKMEPHVAVVCGPLTLRVMLQRIEALDRDDLPAESRAALHKFLDCAAQLLD